MQKKIGYPALALFVAWLFAEGIPVDTFDSASGILTAIGSIAFAALVTLSVFQFIKKERPVAYTVDTKLTEDKGGHEGCLIGILIISSLFGFGIFLIFHGIERTKTELKEHGVYTVATITGGSSYKTRKYDNTLITVHFENKKGEKRVANIDILASQFDKYYQNQQIPIVYSDRYQSLVKVLESDADFSKYTNISVRPVNLKDLKHIAGLSTQKEIEAYLNKLSPEWKYRYSYKDSSDVYVNEIRDTGLKIIEGEVNYILPPGGDLEVFDTDALAQGFERIEDGKISKGIAGQLAFERLYTGGGYILMLQHKQMMPDKADYSNGDYKFQAARSVGVVTLVKQ